MVKRLRSRKGVTVAEVVVALAIIAVISGATMTMFLLSAEVESKSVAALNVKNAAENAIECFRFARANADKIFEEPEPGEYSKYKFTLSTLFFTCLKKSNQNYTHEILPDETFKSSPTVQDGVWIRDDILPECEFTLAIDSCTITITQIVKDGEVTGFTFVAVCGEEELERFTFPKQAE